MPFIDENLIEAVVDQLGASDAAFENKLNELKDKYPLRLGYLFAEDVEALTKEEQSWMLFVGTVIISACEQAYGGHLPMIEEKDLMELEENNWSAIQESKETGFNKRLDVFFQNTDQEDLLAFIEDSLADSEEEENIISKEGKEPMFIMLKTLVDSCTVES
jgi:hypothetical protein